MIRGAVLKTYVNGKVSYLRRPVQKLIPFEVKTVRDNSPDVTTKDIHLNDLQQNHEHEDFDDSEFDDTHNSMIPIENQQRRLAARDGELKRRLNEF